MRRTAAAIGTLAVVATVAVGCGSSDSSSSDRKEETTTTSAAPATETREAGTSGEPTEAELREMLLTAAEMGEGWTVDPSSDDDDDDDSDQPSCLSDLKTNGIINDPRVDISFNYDNGAAYAFEGLTWAGEDPDTTFEAAVDALDGCDDLTIGEGADAVEGTLTRADLPTMGDQSQGWLLSIPTATGEVGVHVVIATQGDILIVAMDGLARGSVTPDATAQFVDGAAAKVAQTRAAA